MINSFKPLLESFPYKGFLLQSRDYLTKLSGMSLRSFAKSHFLLMFSLITLLNTNFAILRSARNTLAVADLGGGANSIPYFELFGALPGALLMTWGISSLLKRFSLRKVFLIALSVFLGFFLLFAFGIYPLLAQGSWPPIFLKAFSLLFYVMAELWKVILFSVLFWALVNDYIPFLEAKKLYAPLMLGGSLGSILAGPLIALCTSDLLWKLLPLSSTAWNQSLDLLVLLLCFVGIAIAWLYHRLFIYFSQIPKPDKETLQDGEALSLKKSLLAFWRSPYLLLLGWMVIADYVAYSLGEVIFLDILKERYPLPRDYCHYMGQLSFWTGILTAFGALVVTPWMLKRFRWTALAIAAPLCLLLTEGAFFVVLRMENYAGTWFHWTAAQLLEWAISLGSIQYCVCRASKYTLFDTSKELSFLHLSSLQKMQGKLVIDGLSSRFGRAGASLMTISLVQMFGSVRASASITGILAIAIGASWLLSSTKLSALVEDPT